MKTGHSAGGLDLYSISVRGMDSKVLRIFYLCHNSLVLLPLRQPGGGDWSVRASSGSIKYDAKGEGVNSIARHKILLPVCVPLG